MGDWLNNKVVPKIIAFINTKVVTAIKDGMLYTMPLLIVGSIFLIFANFPVESVATVLKDAGVSEIFDMAYGATFNICAIIAVMGISYTYVKLSKQEPLAGAFIALAVFLMIQPAFKVLDDGTIVDGLINKDWTAGKGMIGAILVGLLVGWAYSALLKKDIRIKMPAGVPEGVSNAFSALIPAALIIVVTVAIVAVFKIFLTTTVMEEIYRVIQAPLQGISDSIGGVIVLSITGPFLWLFGVHGSTVVGGIMSGIFQANAAENQALINAGIELTVANGGHIVTQQFYDNVINMTGAGLTLGLALYLIAFAKAKQLRTIGKLELFPALFNINEPVLFGLPIVMNPFMAIPFISMPLIAGLIQYFALLLGICPLYSGVIVPWTTPPVISGFLVGDWRTAVMQVVIIVISFFVYAPFVRRIDKLAYAQEQAGNSDEDDIDLDTVTFD